MANIPFCAGFSRFQGLVYPPGPPPPHPPPLPPPLPIKGVTLIILILSQVPMPKAGKPRPVWGNGLASIQMIKRYIKDEISFCLLCQTLNLLYVRLTHTPYITSGHGWTLVNVGFTMAIAILGENGFMDEKKVVG